MIHEKTTKLKVPLLIQFCHECFQLALILKGKVQILLYRCCLTDCCFSQKRALKLQQQKQKELLEKEQQREKELERERQLIAKPAKRT